MDMTGKILFFNETDGNGIIIASTKEKVTFSVMAWDDFDVMPSLGLEVSFQLDDNKALSITSINNSIQNNKETGNIEEKISEPDEANIPEEDTTTADNSQNQQDIEETIANVDDSEKEEKNTEDKIEDKYFKSDEDVDIVDSIEDVVEEIGEREESVTVTLNLSHAVKNYFNVIKENIDKRASYKKVEGRLDYLTVKRFLWTTFNNLNEIDLHIITPVIKAMSDDLKDMAHVNEDFERKTKYPPLAYKEVFLSCQAEYMKIKVGSEKTIERLNQLKGSEKRVGGVLKVKKDELSKHIKTEEFDILQDEFKSLNGAYVDIVHMMAELDDRYKHDMKLLVEFEKEYREDFYELFAEASVLYKKDLIEILSAQAFVLDQKLWTQAKSSKAVKAHFHKAGISGEFNTKTYLKYYLDTQDSAKSTCDTQALFKLYDYLCAKEKHYILIVVTTPQEAMEYETAVKNIDKKAYEVKAFIDEKSALKWAIKHSVRILILEDRLANFSTEIFLKYYKKYILVIPKIIVLGANIKSDFYSIEKLLSKDISPRALSKSVQKIFSTTEDNN